ncbi:M15 family metallopeptidase [Lysobacter sp. A378]
MRGQSKLLINTPKVELWPSGLLHARSNHDARILSRANHILRRKRDGRYLAAQLPEGLVPLIPRLTREPGVTAALEVLAKQRGVLHPGHAWSSRLQPDELPLDGLRERLDALGLDDGYGERTGLPLVAEPGWLTLAGLDRYRRPLWLRAGAARAWTHLREAARQAGVALEAISGYRSHDYQLGIFERKLARGQAVPEILRVNAAPGYSEHHSGFALDIGTPGEPPAEETFEQTPAFDWLTATAGSHGFAMSYPRDNPHGIVYEPWHWRWAPQETE